MNANCSVKAFFVNEADEEIGYSIGWEAWCKEPEETDASTALRFVEERILHRFVGDVGTHLVDVCVKDCLGAPIRFSHTFKILGCAAPKVLADESPISEPPPEPEPSVPGSKLHPTFAKVKDVLVAWGKQNPEAVMRLAIGFLEAFTPRTPTATKPDPKPAEPTPGAQNDA